MANWCGIGAVDGKQHFGKWVHHDRLCFLKINICKEIVAVNRLLSCEFNLDTACVELKFADGSMVSIDTISVEDAVANNMYQRSELDYLIYNDPVAYADLILNGDPETYLKTVTEYIPLDYSK
jgi:hypothetical protein